MTSDADTTLALLRATFAGRADVLDRLSRGGQAEVWRLRDLALDRPMVVKFPRQGSRDADWQARFENEARIQARLEHPAVPPVYGSGRLPDTRPWYTMRELSHRPLSDLVRAPPVDEDELWLRVGWVQRACEAVGHAHGRGIVHRDLKPANLVLDEVAGLQVIDWGLAGLVGHIPDGALLPQAQRPRESTVAGTFEFMPPEQIRGGLKAAGPRGDVFGLGVTLYFVATNRHPFRSLEPEDRLAEIARGAWQDPTPASLAAIVRMAMAERPEDRFADAGELADALESWLDRARRDRDAAAAVQRAEQLMAQAEARAADAEAQRRSARAALMSMPLAAPETQKRPAWAQEDAANAADASVALLEDEALALLASACEQLPGYEPARARQADLWLRRAERAEERGQRLGLEALHRQVRRYGGMRHLEWLRGDGAVTLVTDPPGAEVWLFQFGLTNRRLAAEPVGDGPFGRTPLVEQPLAHGSYLLLIRLAGHLDVAYPVCIRRGEHWHGRPPWSDRPEPVWLPPMGLLSPSDVYVPAGWFAYGDEAALGSYPPGRIWLPGFVAQRELITNADYIAWLDALVQGGERERALVRVPSHRDTPALYTLQGERFVPCEDSQGDRATLDRPVAGICWEDLVEYAAWLASTQGRKWRLPRELEWEKLAKGVDGRTFPWGDMPEPSFANVEGSPDGVLRATLKSTSAYPQSTSVYGARGMAGHLFQLCADWCRRVAPVSPEGRIIASEDPKGIVGRTGRGGCWSRTIGVARSSTRLHFDPTKKDGILGGRLVVSLDGLTRG